MIREYLKLSRFFNMGLTGVAPVLGALAMWGTVQPSLSDLVILFCIGCCSHIYGFVLNDIVDINIDKLSQDLRARPLVSSTIGRKKATLFAVLSMIVAFLLSLFFFETTQKYLSLLSILFVAYILATLYDMGSKKYPGMDIFVASAVFFLIIFGAASISIDTLFITSLPWIVALIGSIQVLFMNMINGAIKDIDHDAKGQAKTVAIRLGAQANDAHMALPVSFKVLGYGIEICRSFLIFYPFLFLTDIFSIIPWQLVVLILLTGLIFFSIHRLFVLKTFKRDQVRRHIGIIVIFMYATTPVMLSSLNPFILLLALVPPLWFVMGNIVLHGTIFEPKTM